jgi:hypothetical protein
MRKYLIIILTLCLSAILGHAQEAVPTIHILPEDVVQDSIQRISSSDGRIAVRWQYTEAGAKKMLAFWDAHEGQTIRIVAGDFERIGQIALSSVLPPGVASHAEWSQGWLKHRTDKFFSITEEDAKKIMAGLRGV